MVQSDKEMQSFDFKESVAPLDQKVLPTLPPWKAEVVRQMAEGSVILSPFTFCFSSKPTLRRASSKRAKSYVKNPIN